MTKADLRDNYPFGLFAVPRQQLRRLHASSGTTGKSIVVGYTQNDLDHWADLMARSIRAAGGRAGDMVHVAYGYGMFTGGLGAHYGVERLGCIAVPMSGGQTERQVQQIMDFRPEIIMVTPSYSLVIAEEFERLGIKPDEISLRVGLFGAEPWGEGMRHDRDREEARYRRHRHLRPDRSHGPRQGGPDPHQPPGSDERAEQRRRRRHRRRHRRLRGRRGNIGCIVITGSEKAFAAGADIGTRV
jgi:hypothetical protein